MAKNKIWLYPLPQGKEWFQRKDIIMFLGFSASLISKYQRLFPELRPKRIHGKGSWGFYSREKMHAWAFVKELRDMRMMGPQAIRVELDRKAAAKEPLVSNEAFRTDVEKPGPVLDYAY